MNIEFTKMQGTGNDFIIIDSTQKNLKNISSLSKKLCNRRFGVGADQLILIQKSEKADFKMKIFNADGSEAQMCGNGVRCISKYIYCNRLKKGRKLEIETLAGIIKTEMINGEVMVDMGTPFLNAEDIPIKGFRGKVIDEELNVLGRKFNITCVSMGNPHCVIFLKNLKNFEVGKYGPIIERHKAFPERTNVEFVEVINRGLIKVNIWERGSGETLACGTGACASLVAGVLNKKTDMLVKVDLPGGMLSIKWNRDKHVYLRGGAKEVFRGEIEI